VNRLPRRASLFRRLPPLALVLLVAVLSLLPIARLMLAAIAPGGVPDIAGFAERLARPQALRALWHTLDTAFLGAVLSLVIGAPFAVAVAMTDLPGRRLAAFLVLLPLMIAPQVTALSWLHLLGPSSVLLNSLGLAPAPGSPNPLLGRGGIILLYGVQHAPLVFILLRAGLSQVPRDLVEAARSSGSSPPQALRRVVLPLVRQHLVAAAALAFVSGVGNFGIPALLGLPVNYLTLPTLIYRQLASFGPSVLPQVASLSLLTGALALAGVAAQALALRGRHSRFAPGLPARFPLGRFRLLSGAAAWAVIGVILVLPGLALAATSLVPTFGVALSFETLTLANYREVLVTQAATVRAFANSAMLSSVAALLLALLAIPAARVLENLPPAAQRALTGAAELPYAVPGIVLAIAAILLFLRPLPLVGSLYGTAAIILVAYLMRFFVLPLRSVAVAVRQIPRELDEAAAVAGAGPLRRLATIAAPLAAPAAVAGGLLVFMTAFNELTVSALLWSSGSETLGVILFSLEEAGLGTQAAALAVATVAVVVALLALLNRLGARLPPGALPWR
jgi:iron(III) transport system permease protein